MYANDIRAKFVEKFRAKERNIITDEWHNSTTSSCRTCVYVICVRTCMYSDSECRSPYSLCGETKSARMSPLPQRRKGAREKLYGIIETQPAFPRARQVCFADACMRRTGVTYLLCVSKRVARFLRAGECR